MQLQHPTPHRKRIVHFLPRSIIYSLWWAVVAMNSLNSKLAVSILPHEAKALLVSFCFSITQLVKMVRPTWKVQNAIPAWLTTIC